MQPSSHLAPVRNVRTNAIDEHDIFLFDLDDTIAREGLAPGLECVGALARLLLDGKHVGIVTARGPEELTEVAAAFAPHLRAPTVAERLRYFASSASVVLRHSKPESGQVLEREVSCSTEEHDLFVQELAVQLRRVAGVTVIDRGPQQTVVSANDASSFRVRKIIAPHEARLRALFVSRHLLHLLPKDCGKHAAVDYYRGVLGDVRSVAIGDGFYEAREIEIRGNDMDFVGKATTCIQVGRIKPRNRSVLFLPLGADGPSSVVRVLGEMGERSTAALSAHCVLERPAAAALEAALERCATTPSIRSFFSKLVEYNLSTLEPSDTDRRGAAAVETLQEGGSLTEAVASLAQGGPLDAGFARWAGFEGDWKWAFRWLWDEHIARPLVAFTRLFDERVRVPLLPEELAVSLIRALPHLSRGNRVVFIGKDAECVLPIFSKLVDALRVRGVLKNECLPPVGLKVSARKTRRRTAVDSAEHLELGSVARQLRTMLEDDERHRSVSTAVRKRAIEAASSLSADDHRLLAVAFEGQFDHCLETSSLEELISRLADLRSDPDFERYIALGRGVIYGLQRHPVGSSHSSAVESLIETYLPGCGVDTRGVAARYEAMVGRGWVRTAEDLRALTGLLSEVIGERYLSLRDLDFPFAPILRALMSETRIRHVLGARPLFIDASFNSGTTILFLRAVGRIVAPDVDFGFAALGGVLVSDQLEQDLDWHGHAHLPVLLEEGAPHTFDFFYDEDDARVTYASCIGRLGDISSSQSASSAHIEGLCVSHAACFERFPELAQAGLAFSDVVRWWLRRDKIWEMRVLSDLLRFRWPHSSTVQIQQSAIALLEGLDALTDTGARARLQEADGPLRLVETRALLEDWMQRKEAWNSRGFAFGDRIAEHAALVAGYIEQPSPAQWRLLQRVLMTTLQPPAAFV